MSELIKLQERKEVLEFVLPSYLVFMTRTKEYTTLGLSERFKSHLRLNSDHLFDLTQTARDHLELGISNSIDEMRIELQLINEKLEAIETLLAT